MGGAERAAPAPASAGGPDLVLRPTLCPICGTDARDREIYPMNFAVADLDPGVFSARRLPDRLHYRMVRCGTCGLLRSNPILPTWSLASLYEQSRFTYAGEAEFTRRTYARYLRRALAHASRRGSLLEIGCGNGFFLEEALEQGVREVWGVEPSLDAIARAPERVRSRIRAGLYDSSTFSGQRFDLVCCFQVFDHVPDQGALLAACAKDLEPGGVALFINHDSRAPLALLLGERNPMIDVEHTALFDKRTMRRLFEKHGFTVCDAFGVRNTYPLAYWAKLAPLPSTLKKGLLSALERSRVGRWPITLSAGNLGIIAKRSVSA